MKRVNPLHQPSLLPEAFLIRMDQEERKRLGKAGLTQAEAETQFLKQSERQEQRIFDNWLRFKQIEFIGARADQKSTIEVGWPDRTIILPHAPVFFIELKVEGGRLSKEQVAVIDRLQSKGCDVYIALGAHAAITRTQQWLEQWKLYETKHWVISPEDFDLCEHSWIVRRFGNYPYVQSVRLPYRMILMHRLIMERMLGRSLIRGEEVDHINHLTTDNRRCNLRVATRAQNNANSSERTKSYFSVQRRSLG